MRTKNAKRLWPVPATLTVVALAAFLAFGLMATTGVQPAEAQDADCTITIGSDGISIDADNTDENCDAFGDTATIKLVGPSVRPVAPNTGPIAVYVLAEDDDGDEDIYESATFWQSVDATNSDRERGTFYDGRTGVLEATKTSYTGQNVEVTRAAQQGTTYVAQSTIVTVKGEGTVHVFLPGAFGDGITEAVGCTSETTVCDDDDPSPPSSARMFIAAAPANASATVAIRFLGVPALGKDLPSDLNDDLDDEILAQCYVTASDDEDKIVSEGTDEGTCPEALESNSGTVMDASESRSKLVVRTGAADATSGDAFPLIDGKTLTHTMDDDDAVTIYAVVEDAKGQPLADTEVSFSSVTNPSGIVAARDLMDEDDAEAAGSTLATDLEGVVDTDAIVAYTLDGLDKVEGPYSITVEVMAGDLKLGTVTITRPDSPETIVAGVFNSACFTPGGEDDDDYSLATFNAKNKGCDDSGMVRRFGAGEMIFVKAHLEDSLDNVVGESDDLDSELADEFDDPLIDGDPVEIENPVSGKLMPKAWIYTVDEDAQLGDHMITVSTTANNADEEDIDDVTLTVTVAGPPAAFTISGPDRIDLGGSGTFTVAAADANDGAPHFTIDDDTDDSMVGLFIQGLTPGNVRGLTAGGMLDLDDDTGMASFTVYAPPGTVDGATVRIFVGEGDLEASHTVVFGMAPTAPGMPMNVMAMATSHDMITVSWDAVMDATSYMVQRGYMDADNMMWMTVAEMTTDTMYMDSGLMAATTYYYRVTAMNAAGMGEYSDGMAMATTDAPASTELTAPSGVVVSPPLANTQSVSVTWNPASIQNAQQIKVVLFNSGVTGLAQVDRPLITINAGNDPGSATFNDVPDGMYNVVVASFRTGEPHKLSPFVEVTVE